MSEEAKVCLEGHVLHTGRNRHLGRFVVARVVSVGRHCPIGSSWDSWTMDFLRVIPFFFFQMEAIPSYVLRPILTSRLHHSHAKMKFLMSDICRRGSSSHPPHTADVHVCIGSVGIIQLFCKKCGYCSAIKVQKTFNAGL